MLRSISTYMLSYNIIYTLERFCEPKVLNINCEILISLTRAFTINKLNYVNCILLIVFNSQ